MATTTTTADKPKFNLPSDAKMFKVGNKYFAVFTVGGVPISYSVDPKATNFNAASVRTLSGAQFHGLKTVNGGSAEELRGLKEQWGSYGKFWGRILDEVIGTTNPARRDAGVLRVLAEYAARPDMSAQELQNKLQGTQWYQTRTQAELEWNSLAAGEKDKRRIETAQDMAGVWLQYGGVNIDATDPRVKNYLERVASGKMGFGAFTEMVKKQAEADPDSPWARQLAEMEKSRNERGINIENTAQRIRDLARRWGVQMSDSTYTQMATEVVAGTKSDADVLKTFQQQASVLFPWKDPEMETATAAGPWVETYKRLMETETDLMNPKVQQAMSAGMSVWDFEKSLKKSPEWMKTKNAKDEMTSLVSEVGRRMGFE